MKALSRMNKTELIDEANRHGYEVEAEDTVSDLREIVAALREESAAGIDQNAPLEAPESTESDDSPESDSTPDEPTIDLIQTGKNTYHGAPGENQVLIRVNGDKGKTVLWERHRWHPGGEVFLRGGMTAVAGRTPAVEKLLGTKLAEVE